MQYSIAQYIESDLTRVITMDLHYKAISDVFRDDLAACKLSRIFYLQHRYLPWKLNELIDLAPPRKKNTAVSEAGFLIGVFRWLFSTMSLASTLFRTSRE